MSKRTLVTAVLAAALSLFAVTDLQAATVKQIILAEVDPGGAQGTQVKFYDELTPEQQAEFNASYETDKGTFISAVATLAWKSGEVKRVQTTGIFIVLIDGGRIVVPVSVTCRHSGCGPGCEVAGCNPAVVNGSVVCSGGSCNGSNCEGPICSKSTTLSASGFVVFGSIDTP